MNELSTNQEYVTILTDIKKRISESQLRAAFAVNHELIELYWHIGNEIIRQQKEKPWGSKFLENLSFDLKNSFPNLKGFSSRNLKYMRSFAEAYPFPSIGQQPVAQLPWSHNILILQKVANERARIWYAHKILENGWSRAVLKIQLDNNLYERQQDDSKKISNFAANLPKVQSDLAEAMLKDPYIFDFLNIGDQAYEREVEKELTKHIQKFLLELGAGFAFIGNQHHLEVGAEDFYIDMLFYHLKLRCYVVIELKTTKFKPEYAGKLNFYLSVVDDLVKSPEDNPSIGLLLCRDKDKLVAEYALKDVNKPIGVSEYQIIESIPKELTSSLPTIEQIEAELNQSDK